LFGVVPGLAFGGGVGLLFGDGCVELGFGFGLLLGLVVSGFVSLGLVPFGLFGVPFGLVVFGVDPVFGFCGVAPVGGFTLPVGGGALPVCGGGAVPVCCGAVD
jgi:hypothetical protein